MTVNITYYQGTEIEEVRRRRRKTRRRQTMARKVAKRGTKWESKIKIGFREISCLDLFYAWFVFPEE
jgi:hypothetical protein